MTTPETPPLYSIGHSNRSLEDLIALLRERGVTLLADVRSHPASRRHPQFDRRVLAASLAEAGIKYRWLGRALGGLRKGAAQSPHTALAAAGFQAYADHMLSAEFQEAALQLLELGRRSVTAFMCAERAPQDCHRAYLADYLVTHGAPVVHILAPSQCAQHRLNPLARLDGGRLIYNRTEQFQLEL